ncbi:hypothetical protein TRIUR3_10996 [Triticum urartu]|uniref:Mce/MlaD domain-containing protein n=1 Tax=Triticum urartu TaxID=4572 RepID=M8AXE3_TRIUA|nr:hypothetical protein TRIUR3_10996 [Triticum urartu]
MGQPYRALGRAGGARFHDFWREHLLLGVERPTEDSPFIPQLSISFSLDAHHHHPELISLLPPFPSSEKREEKSYLLPQPPSPEMRRLAAAPPRPLLHPHVSPALGVLQQHGRVAMARTTPVPGSRFRKYSAVFEFSQACGICVGTPLRIRGVTVGSVVRVDSSLRSIDAYVELSKE